MLWIIGIVFLVLLLLVALAGKFGWLSWLNEHEITWKAFNILASVTGIFSILVTLYVIEVNEQDLSYKECINRSNMLRGFNQASERNKETLEFLKTNDGYLLKAESTLPKLDVTQTERLLNSKIEINEQVFDNLIKLNQYLLKFNYDVKRYQEITVIQILNKMHEKTMLGRDIESTIDTIVELYKPILKYSKNQLGHQC